MDAAQLQGNAEGASASPERIETQDTSTITKTPSTSELPTLEDAVGLLPTSSAGFLARDGSRSAEQVPSVAPAQLPPEDRGSPVLSDSHRLSGHRSPGSEQDHRRDTPSPAALRASGDGFHGNQQRDRGHPAPHGSTRDTRISIPGAGSISLRISAPKDGVVFKDQEAQREY